MLDAIVAQLADDASRAGMLAMVYNGEAVVRRGQHRMWRVRDDGRIVWWQPTVKDSVCEVAVSGPGAAVRMVCAALKSFRPRRTDLGVCWQHMATAGSK